MTRSSYPPPVSFEPDFQPPSLWEFAVLISFVAGLVLGLVL